MLLSIMPRASPVIASFVGPLNQAIVKWGVDTSAAIAAFLAQAAEESNELLTLEENLNYRAEALAQLWPSHFTAEDAQAYAHKPEEIANRAYANRMGNGDEASGDGWLYRGRGIFQLTGNDEYAAYSDAQYGDDRVVSNPELLKSAEDACHSAGWFWSTNGLSALAARGQFELITKKINGGLNGLAQRKAYWDRAVEVLVA
jgi:putative chitinase